MQNQIRVQNGSLMQLLLISFTEIKSTDCFTRKGDKWSDTTSSACYGSFFKVQSLKIKYQLIYS